MKDTEEMTLRDYFASKAMQMAHFDYVNGACSESLLQEMFGNRIGLNRFEIIAALADKYADAMLKAREL